MGTGRTAGAAVGPLPADSIGAVGFALGKRCRQVFEQITDTPKGDFIDFVHSR
jgi:hypothetical protein